MIDEHQTELSATELEAEGGIELPAREAMTLIDPNLAGGALPTDGSLPTTDSVPTTPESGAAPPRGIDPSLLQGSGLDTQIPTTNPLVG